MSTGGLKNENIAIFSISNCTARGLNNLQQFMSLANLARLYIQLLKQVTPDKAAKIFYKSHQHQCNEI